MSHLAREAGEGCHVGGRARGWIAGRSSVDTNHSLFKTDQGKMNKRGGAPTQIEVTCKPNGKAGELKVRDTPCDATFPYDAIGTNPSGNTVLHPPRRESFLHLLWHHRNSHLSDEERRKTSCSSAYARSPLMCLLWTALYCTGDIISFVRPHASFLACIRFLHPR